MADLQNLQPIIPMHQWTNGGEEVLVLRYVNKEGKSYNDFQHPLTVGESVTAPDWNDKAECGGGIHGWPWGFHLGEGKEVDWGATWQVYGVKPNDIIDLDGKVKFRTGILRHVGTWHSAAMCILEGQIAWVQQASRGAASATDYRGVASATGYSGVASATGSCTASVVTGTGGKARAGEFGCIALAWWNEKCQRAEMRCALVGDGHLKPDTWYQLNVAGEFEECP